MIQNLVNKPLTGLNGGLNTGHQSGTTKRDLQSNSSPSVSPGSNQISPQNQTNNPSSLSIQTSQITQITTAIANLASNSPTSLKILQNIINQVVEQTFGENLNKIPGFPSHSTPKPSSCYENDDNNSKRRRRHRTVFSDTQLQNLETLFVTTQYPDVATREKLARTLDLDEERVEVWFKIGGLRIGGRLGSRC